MRSLDWAVFCLSPGVRRSLRNLAGARAAIPFAISARRQDVPGTPWPLDHGHAGQRGHVYLTTGPGLRRRHALRAVLLRAAARDVILASTAVPLFHRANVYTAYEYPRNALRREVRSLVSVHLPDSARPRAGIRSPRPRSCSPSSSAGPTGYDDPHGGHRRALHHHGRRESHHLVRRAADDGHDWPVVASCIALWLLPPRVVRRRPRLAAGGPPERRYHDFDWNDRYNIWSGLIGGMFLALAYFGTDQSQVQRYLTGSRSEEAAWACCSTPSRRSRCSSSSCSSARWSSSSTCYQSRLLSSSVWIRLDWSHLPFSE